MILACRSRRLSVTLRLLTKTLSLVFYAASRSFFPLRIYPPSVRMWSALENAPPPITALIGSALHHWKIRYLFFVYVTGFRRLSISTLIGIILRVPTMGERALVFPKKIGGKKVSQIIFPTPVNASPVSQVTRCRNIHPDCIARTNGV